MLGTCSMPWAIKIVNFSERHRDNASYEPELHPGVTYKMREPKATLKIFSTGSITVTGELILRIYSPTPPSRMFLMLNFCFSSPFSRQRKRRGVRHTAHLSFGARVP